jgi:hypothetical protein
MKKYFVALLALFTISSSSFAQMITGVWKGKIDRKKVELKIVQNGDSLTGTSYYYESATNYRRYSIKGYFDANTNSAVWWDDRLIEQNTGKGISGNPGRIPYLSTADFNCPGSGKMFLEGKSALKEDIDKIKGPVDLEKTESGIFSDEWDFVIENYTAGTNDPYIIDSIAAIAMIPDHETEEITTPPVEAEREVILNKPSNNPVEINKPAPSIEVKMPEQKNIILPVPTIEDKFIRRQRVLTKEIPLTGDSIELRFYDNAEIDGDSISLFLNEKLIFQHIRLTASAYTIKLPVNELKESNELIMVAENLGEIPPNTSYMIALVGDKRYDAQLASTEQSSAMIKLIKPKP